MQVFETKIPKTYATIAGNRYVRGPAKYHESDL
jgi:hypothetical protein